MRKPGGEALYVYREMGTFKIMQLAVGSLKLSNLKIFCNFEISERKTSNKLPAN